MYKKFSKVFSFLLSMTMIAGIAVTSANASSISFTDVPKTDWAYTFVTTCADNGWVSGVGNNKFMPDGKLTNAQFATMTVYAMYRDEKSDYEDERWMEMDSYYDGNPKWWSYNAYFMKDNGLLDGTAFENIKSAAVADAPMTRYDMAQVLYNCLTRDGIIATSAQKSAAQASIKDWNQIPTKYRDAVSTCFALGLLSGMGDGSFGGTSTMTRAQACVVTVKLDEALKNGPVQDKPVIETPAPKPSVSDIEVTTKDGGQWGVGYYVADNGYGTGYLNNGKAITEENVKELLAKAEQIWPTGITWTNTGVRNNHWYQSSGSVVDGVLLRKYNCSTNYACSGFASMISDYLFGKDGNPARLIDFSQIRPGDIILEMSGNKVNHVMVATSSPIQNDDLYNGRVYYAAGNASKQVTWPSQWDMPIDNASYAALNGADCYLIVYTRYPA